MSGNTTSKINFTENDEQSLSQKRAGFAHCIKAKQSDLETSMAQFVRNLFFFSTSFPQNFNKNLGHWSQKSLASA
jgi:hypothetical protein